MEKSITFSRRLSEAIQIRGVTQKWLAEKSYTTEATISRYITQSNNPAVLSIITDIAKALNVSTDYLLGMTNIMSEKETIPEEQRIISNCVPRINNDDKRVLYALISKYLTDEEKQILNIKGNL
jgi:transcriptional regulator with XRE-family HTH domain